ncbi:hypothetical protein L1887_60966 [Cichorium endivia]|nr:hypothetical protein L1887_60966 [Cichorium endivia]
MEAPVNGGSNSNCPKRRKSAIVIRESRVEGLSLNGSKGELRGANPSTRGLGWANLWCTGCYANSSAGQLSWYGRTAAPREILLYTSSRTRFLNRTSIGERCKHREEKVTILSCLVSAFSPPLFSPRLGRFFRFFNESLHESCNRIKDILSSRSVCLMPSIESIGAISSLGGRAIDSSCPWLVKGMSGIGKHDKSVLHILASSLVFKERKLQRLTEEKAEAKKSNQCSFRAQPKDPILAAAGALDGTGKTVHE